MQQIQKMQQEVKQLRHQLKLLTQANKAIFMSGLMRKAVCASKTWWYCSIHQEARGIHCKLSQANKITFMSGLEAQKTCFTVQCYWIKHLLGVVTLSERLPLRKLLAPADFTDLTFMKSMDTLKAALTSDHLFELFLPVKVVPASQPHESLVVSP